MTGLTRATSSQADGVAASFVAVQPSFDGGARLYGELDAVTTATVVGTVDRAASSSPNATTPVVTAPDGATATAPDAATATPPMAATVGQRAGRSR